jgi:hypothetical protein
MDLWILFYCIHDRFMNVWNGNDSFEIDFKFNMNWLIASETK